jgi:hypothetical protein
MQRHGWFHRSLSGFVIALLFGTALAAMPASAAQHMCIARYGAIVHQAGTATCSADATSTATARGDGAHAEATNHSSATANGDGAYAEATNHSTATANGAGSKVVTDGGGNIGIANGIDSNSVADAGTGNTALATGNDN